MHLIFDLNGLNIDELVRCKIHSNMRIPIVCVSGGTYCVRIRWDHRVRTYYMIDPCDMQCTDSVIPDIIYFDDLLPLTKSFL